MYGVAYMTRSGRPNSLKRFCAGSLHELRHMPLQFDSCKNLHFSTTSPPSCPSARRFSVAGPTRKPNAKGATAAADRDIDPRSSGSAVRASG